MAPKYSAAGEDMAIVLRTVGGAGSSGCKSATADFDVSVREEERPSFLKKRSKRLFRRCLGFDLQRNRHGKLLVIPRHRCGLFIPIC
jgi:hypothetical protein